MTDALTHPSAPSQAVLRPAGTDDAAAIARIWNAMILDTLATFNSTPKTDDDLRELIAARAEQGHGFLLACEPGGDGGGPVLGFATYGQFRGGVGYARAFEHTVVMDAAARGRGLGRTLMQGLEEHARGAGGHVLMAGVSAANPDGIRFHATIGFAEVARLSEVGFKNGRYLDLVLMQKML